MIDIFTNFVNIIWFLYSCSQQIVSTKKGYYIRRVKEGLWATFGINRLKPYDKNFTREQLKNWKAQKNVRKAYNDLYTPIDPNDSNSEMFISMIIKKRVCFYRRTNRQKRSMDTGDFGDDFWRRTSIHEDRFWYRWYLVLEAQ